MAKLRVMCGRALIGGGLLLLLLFARAAEAAGPQRVLLRHSDGREFAPFNRISATFRPELARPRAERFPPPPLVAVFNPQWRELRRWGLGETRLPLGREVRSGVPPFWEKYPGQLLAIHALCLLEGLLIFLLLRNRRQLREAQRELRRSEEHLSLATSSAKVGIWSWNVAHGTIEATPEAKEMFGWAAHEPVTFPGFLARLHPDDRAAVQHAVDGALQGQAIYDLQYRVVRPDGQTRWIAARGRAQPQRGRPEHMVGVLLDVTEREQAQAEAQRQRAELAHVARVSTLGELAASVAHELNQPLGAILSNAEAAELFLRQDPPALNELRDILLDIRRDNERASEVLRRMRSLLRKRDLEMQPLNLNSVVQDVFRLVRSDAALRKTTLTAALSSRLPEVRGDRVHLQQVLLNLVMNALEAMATQAPEQRRLTVGTRLADRAMVEVTVSDGGPGIAPDHLGRLFEPFFTTKPNGMGMGLAIARRIIEAHHGTLSAENQADGGATFRLRLPVSTATQPS